MARTMETSRTRTVTRSLATILSREDALPSSRSWVFASPGSIGCSVYTFEPRSRDIWAQLRSSTALILALPLLHSRESGMTVQGLWLLGLLAFVPASDLAIALINRSVMALLGPQRLPRMELRKGVPEDLRTIVVVPTLLTTAREVEEQVERLEVHYLANPDGDLRFALLSDWMDAPCETLPEDDDLLALRCRRHCAAEPTLWSSPRRRGTLFPLSSQARLERARREMDGVGAQARKAA